MASIVKRKANYAVVYWYLDETDTRKQKWETCVTKKEANTRKTFIEYYYTLFLILINWIFNILYISYSC